MECSVILSAYCGKKYLRAQLDSILNQSRVPDEIIVIDDCSPDHGETEEIIDEYVATYPIVKKHVNSQNMGWAASFMNGINYATRDVVFFSDQDDIWDKEKIKSMMRVMEREGVNALMSDCLNVNEKLTPLDKHISSGELTADKYPFGIDFINPKGVGAAMSFKRDFLRKYMDLWNPSIGHDRFYQIMAVCFDRIYYLDLPLIWHRFHEGNATGSANRTFSAQSRIDSIEGNIRLITDIKNSPFWKDLDEEKKKVIEGYVRFGNARKEVLERKSLLKWFGLVYFRLGYYPTKKTWLGDLKCIL